MQSLAKAGATLALLAATLSAAGDRAGTPDAWPSSEFHFTRLQYSSHGAYARGGYGSWQVDYPEAEFHFSDAVGRLTRIDIDADARIFPLRDDAIFDYPWLYAVEVGSWQLSDREAERLREYLLRGGFLMVDDFHGTRQWAGFMESLQRVFPDRPVIDVRDDDEVLHVLYDVDERIQIPGVRPLMYGRTYEEDGTEPRWAGVYDDDGRLMVAINHNMDLGDAWEHADDPRYPEPMTALAYRFAVNYAVYALTH